MSDNSFNIKEVHRKAMSFSQKASMALESGDSSLALELYEKAFNLEKEAAMVLEKEYDKEPTRSALFKSAAVLAQKCLKFREAEQMIGYLLSGNPIEHILEEAKDVYDNINFYRHLELQYEALDPSEIQLSLAGNAVGHGLIIAQEFITRHKAIETLAFRTAERKLGNKKYTGHGGVHKTIKDRFKAYIEAPKAASFAIKIRLGRPLLPQEKMTLFPDSTQAEIIDEILDGLELINQSKEEELKKLINSKEYYQNFMGLAKEIAPDGERVKTVGLTVIRGGIEKVVHVKKRRSSFSFDANKVSDANSKSSIEVIEGILNRADGKLNKIRIESDSQEKIMIKVPDGLTDIVKLHWGENVKVRFEQEGKKRTLLDIEMLN